MQASNSCTVEYSKTESLLNKMSNLYPDVKELIEQNEEGHVTLDEAELQKIFFGDRYNLMLQKKEELDGNRKRYQKSKTRYNLLNNVQNISFIAITSTLTIGTIILTSGIAVPFFLIPMLSGFSLFSIASSGAITKLIKWKKGKMQKKIDTLNSLLAKMEVFVEKAKEDGTISPQEIAQFNKLLEKKTVVVENKKDQPLEDLVQQIIRRELNSKSVLGSSLQH